ncbi:hypothetical protein HZH68_013433 [Vespula germanica]|uniref:Uncharacterized protein n=1 Tax=Vespula germanica TaxID=30212 RepID=A0A834JD42_VESGE|nr:hypothetical protein HZH68_013433 [Vespula germanica]
MDEEDKEEEEEKEEDEEEEEEMRQEKLERLSQIGDIQEIFHVEELVERNHEKLLRTSRSKRYQGKLLSLPSSWTSCKVSTKLNVDVHVGRKRIARRIEWPARNRLLEPIL